MLKNLRFSWGGWWDLNYTSRGLCSKSASLSGKLGHQNPDLPSFWPDSGLARAP